ncbi:hypothetical protein VO54_01530 [Elizabethkingia miricola]|nr:hypothetical protein VO54_01530 [Elizabethkingia miricola]
MKKKKEKILTILLIATTLALSSEAIAQNNSHGAPATAKKLLKEKKKTDLNYLRKYSGQSASEGLLDDPSVKARIIRLIGVTDYKYMKKNWNVETPISIVGPVLEAEGCKKHNCDNVNFIIIIDMDKGLFDIGVKKEGMKALTFSDNNSTPNGAPGDLEDWAKKNMNKR